MSGDLWWFVAAGREAGPITWAALQERAREGLVRPSDPVWRAGFVDWVPAETIEGLLGPGVAPAPPPHPASPRPTTPSGKSRISAALFALLLGGFGAHKFYMGDTGLGVVYLLFCWTLIPRIVSLIEGIVYLAMSDVEFATKYR
jgi:TM2 domain-containing membrane protein YozV